MLLDFSIRQRFRNTLKPRRDVRTGSGSDRVIRLWRAWDDIDRFLNSTPEACVPNESPLTKSMLLARRGGYWTATHHAGPQIERSRTSGDGHHQPAWLRQSGDDIRQT